MWITFTTLQTNRKAGAVQLKMKAALLFVAMSCFSTGVLGDYSDIMACTFTSSSGKTFDFSPLISKDDMAYQWNQTVYDTSDNMYTNPDFSNKKTLNFQMQICRNITKPIHPEACNVSAATYMYDPETKNCVSFGKLEVATFEANPFKDGAHLNLYYGDTVSHIMRFKGKIYFVCDMTTEMNGPVFEHLKENYDGHFHIFTKYAC